jgi:hypothetical protein
MLYTKLLYDGPEILLPAGLPNIRTDMFRGFPQTLQAVHDLPLVVSADFVSTLQDLIPEVIPSQKCYVNMGQILNGY